MKSTRIKIDADDLLKWARYLDEVPKQTRPAIARAMNDYGNSLLDSAASTIASKTGLAASDVRNQIVVKRATSSDLTWKMDASKVAPQVEWERPWNKRSDKEFEKETLVKIITSGDEHTCEICEERPQLVRLTRWTKSTPCRPSGSTGSQKPAQVGEQIYCIQIVAARCSRGARRARWR